jgi:hypothetical protein
MPEQAKDATERAIVMFNREFSPGNQGFSEEMRDNWVREPVIVPLRAALEGNEYTGPSALEQFSAETRESWDWLQIEIAEIRELDPKRALVIGDLVGRGRETGAVTRARLAWLFVIEEGKVAEARTFASADEALTAVNT